MYTIQKIIKNKYRLKINIDYENTSMYMKKL